MSTQLILYPQNYQGFNDISLPVFNEYIVNGIDFLNLSSAPLHSTTAGYPSEDAIINAPPSIVNTWYRYRTSGSPWGSVAPPLGASGNLSLWFNGVTNGHTGVYQKMSSLTVGLSYDITINLTPAASGIVALEIWTGTTLQSNFLFGSNVSQITATFTANSPNDIFLIDYEGTSAILYIADISITESAQNPSGVFTELQDGQVICDLYQEEDIPLTLSVDEFKNVAEKVQSYSKDFNLPATKRNNKIFDSIFEVTRTDTGFNFNAYVKTKCVLKQDGYILFDGYLRLIDIKDKEGEVSYDVNLYSEVVALADTLKDKKFADLDFTDLTHDYNYTNIRESWQGNLPLSNPLSTNSFAYDPALGVNNTGVLKYPFVDWTHQYTLDATTGYPILPNLESSFRPFIKIKYLIERIFADTPFTFTSDFFDTTDFGKLYMDFNWGSDNVPLAINTSGQAENNATAIAAVGWTALEQNLNTYSVEMGYSAGVYTASNDTQAYDINYDFRLYGFQLGASSPALPFIYEFRWKLVKSGVVSYINQLPITGTGTNYYFYYTGSLSETLDNGDTLTPQFRNTTFSSHELNHMVSTANITTAVTSSDATTTETMLDTLRGELGQWEFLKGLMTMFNLVTMPDPDNPNNILIEPYSDVFITNTAGTNLASRSIQHDWTDKVDVSEMELTPLTDLNKKTVFKFVEDDDDYAFNVYKNSVSGFLYGSKNYDASGFTILEGIDEIIAEPFAATIPKPLDDLFSDFITPSIYSMNDDGSTEGFENSPRIMYNNGVKTLTSCTYSVPAQNGVAGDATEDEFLQFSHLTDIPTIVTIPSADTDTRDFHFGECQLIDTIGAATVNNLYSIYWSPYYDELYNADTRIMTMKVNLTPADINGFKMNDKVMIKNRIFRVNKIDYKPNDLAKVEFILIP